MVTYLFTTNIEYGNNHSIPILHIPVHIYYPDPQSLGLDNNQNDNDLLHGLNSL